LHDNFDSEFERLLNFDKSFFEGEEEEGYASANNIERIMLILKKSRIAKNL